MIELAIIGGTGLSSLPGFKKRDESIIDTSYGQTSAPLVSGQLYGKDVVFLARHGIPHRIPPHKVNYRANIRALSDQGVSKIISINAVGGITESMLPGVIVVPDQLIDYTWSREQTFFSDGLDRVVHVDFTHPYSHSLRNLILDTAAGISLEIVNGGVYGATQGPRLETAAEIRRMENDGCDIVGMTGMPEAVLARELDIDYTAVCLVVNLAAGKSNETITMDLIQTYLHEGMERINELLSEFLRIR